MTKITTKKNGALIGIKRKLIENGDRDEGSSKRPNGLSNDNSINNESMITVSKDMITSENSVVKNHQQVQESVSSNLSSSEIPEPQNSSSGSSSNHHGVVSMSILSASMHNFMKPLLQAGSFCSRCNLADEDGLVNNDCPTGIVSSPSVELIIQQYVACTKLYRCEGANAGVVTAIRFSLPNLRVSSPFTDADMLALVEILFQHCNDSLQFIKTLDFRSIRKPKRQNGFHSHGAIALSKLLIISQHISTIILNDQTNLGFHSAHVLFQAISQNPTITSLHMKNCRIGRRGALAFVQHILSQNTRTSLQKVDLRFNRIGYTGCNAVEVALEKYNYNDLDVNLDGNLVFQEIMNGVTHGCGVLLAIIGTIMLMTRVKHASFNHKWSCGLYSASLLVLYTSSTLFHSFFALNATRTIFSVLDHCAIYILIAGSYTPFLCIALHHHHYFSTYLLEFLWICCFGGIIVEAKYPDWKYKTNFSLAMYLGMGWSVLICLQELQDAIIKSTITSSGDSPNNNALKLLVLGGVGYTSGVPFFVRNDNLDHSIWHCFVLTGSIFHWLCIYLYIAPMHNPDFFTTAKI